eukprot:g4104.t1
MDMEEIEEEDFFTAESSESPTEPAAMLTRAKSKSDELRVFDSDTDKSPKQRVILGRNKSDDSFTTERAENPRPGRLARAKSKSDELRVNSDMDVVELRKFDSDSSDGDGEDKGYDTREASKGELDASRSQGSKRKLHRHRKSWLKFLRFKPKRGVIGRERKRMPNRHSPVVDFSSSDEESEKRDGSDNGGDSGDDEDDDDDDDYDYDDGSDGWGDDFDGEHSMTRKEKEEEERIEKQRKMKALRSALTKFERGIISRDELDHLLKLWQLDGVELSELENMCRSSSSDDRNDKLAIKLAAAAASNRKATGAGRSFRKKSSSGLKLLRKGLAHSRAEASKASKGGFHPHTLTGSIDFTAINSKTKSLERKASVVFSSKRGVFEGRGLRITTSGIETQSGIATCGHRVTIHELDFCRLRRLGHGAGGVVFSAVHVPTLRKVALKEVKLGNNIEMNRRIWQEVQTMYGNLERLRPLSGWASSKSCPYLVGFHGAYIAKNGGHITLVMELMDGGELQQLVHPPVVDDDGSGDDSGAPTSRPTPMPISEALLANIAYAILRGLAFLHKGSRIHRDLKPANVLLSRDGSIKISDYGIATKLETKTPRRQRRYSTSFVGTKAYMSPERLNGNPYSYPADVWSLGILVLALMLGRLPFPSKALMFSFELIKIVNEGIDNWDIPPNLFKERGALADFVRSCIRIDPEKRGSVESLLDHPWIRQYRVGPTAVRDLLRSAMVTSWDIDGVQSAASRSAKRRDAEANVVKVAKHIATVFGDKGSPSTRQRKRPELTWKNIQQFVGDCGADSPRANARISREFLRVVDLKGGVTAKQSSKVTKRGKVGGKMQRRRPYATPVTGRSPA